MCHNNVPRYIVQSHRPDSHTAAGALRQAIGLCETHHATSLALLVPAKRNFPITVFGSVLGKVNAKRLCKGETLSICGVAIRLESVRTVNAYEEYGVVLGVHLSARDQDVLDSIRQAKAIVLLSFTEEDGRIWMDAWHPEVLGQKKWDVAPCNLHADVQDALRRLTETVNLSSGISHPLDKKAAEGAFAGIRGLGLHVEPEAVRGWALRNGWEPRHAQDLKKMAEKCF